MAALHITDIEAAINWWRDRSPSPDGITACAEVRALGTVYALMVYYHEVECDEAIALTDRAYRRSARVPGIRVHRLRQVVPIDRHVPRLTPHHVTNRQGRLDGDRRLDERGR